MLPLETLFLFIPNYTHLIAIVCLVPIFGGGDYIGKGICVSMQEGVYSGFYGTCKSYL